MHKIYIPAGTIIRPTQPKTIDEGIWGIVTKVGLTVRARLEDGVYTFSSFGREYSVAAKDVRRVS